MSPSKRQSYDRFFDGQQLFRVAAYSRIVGQHPSTTYRQIARGELPVLLTADGPRITRETIVKRMGSEVKPAALPKKRWLRPFANKRSIGKPPGWRP